MTGSINIYMVYIGCFFGGFSYSGDVNNTATILTDFLPLSKRWILTLVTITWAIGSTILALLALLLNFYSVEAILIFRIIFGVVTFFSVISLIGRILMDESPKFYLATGKPENA